MIKLLSNDVVNKIAAGEVVERPASVLKELLENSIDAKSTEIKVYIKDFGTTKIQIIDNGIGIEKSDLDKVFIKHATSKITEIQDLERIYSFGFRGEALASISSVSKVILNTKHANNEIGSEVEFNLGNLSEIKPSAIKSGTDIQILNLFENIPARKKFLKTKSTENKALIDIFNKFVLANPNISFFIDIDGFSKNYPAGSQKERISKLLKMDELVEINYDGVVKVSGFVIHPRVFLKSKSYQYTFVNKRPVNDATIYKSVLDGFDTFLMKNQFPGYVIFVDIPANLVDINVHPRKTEVRFINPSDIYKSVKNAVNVNLNKFLKNETLEKLKIINNEKEIQDFKIENPISLENKQENIISESKKDFSDFESFLISEPEKTYINGNSNFENNKLEVFEKTKENLKESSMLFNQEIISEEKNSIYLDFANSTQLLESYIITSNGKDILIIDQHAASERYFYEKYLESIKAKKVVSKTLLFPEVVNLNHYDLKIIEENKDLFISLGFDFETFGDEEIKFNQVPEFVKMNDFAKIIEKIIHDILENGEISNIKDKIYHEIAAILACHTAVRFGDKLTREEIIKILKNLSECEDPYNCPHGRPVIQEFSKYDIEKRFKRCGI